FVTKKGNDIMPDWVFETPKTIRENSIFELYTSYKTNFKLLKQKKIEKFSVKFRSKKENQSIQINKEAITLKKKLKIFPTFLTPIRISKEKGIIIDHACKLKKEGSRWFFLVPQDIKVISCPKLEIASLDPGIRK